MYKQDTETVRLITFLTLKNLSKMKWSEHTWQTIKDLYQSILKMPFIKELSEGSLPQEKFRFYMAQDSLYLEHFGRTLSLIAAKITDLQDVLAFMRFAENAIVVENALHESYFKDFGLNDKGSFTACLSSLHSLPEKYCTGICRNCCCSSSSLLLDLQRSWRLYLCTQIQLTILIKNGLTPMPERNLQQL
jgi:hypothetical protein